MIIGTLMVTGIYRNFGPVSRSSQYQMKNFQTDTRGPGRLTKIRAGLDHLWPSMWSGMSKAAQTKEKTAVGH